MPLQTSSIPFKLIDVFRDIACGAFLVLLLLLLSRTLLADILLEALLAARVWSAGAASLAGRVSARHAVVLPFEQGVVRHCIQWTRTTFHA